MLSQKNVKQICAKFGIQAHQIEVIHKGVYQIITPKGRKYCLKRMPYSPDHLRWIDRTLQTMRRNNGIQFGWRNEREPSKHPLIVHDHSTTPYALIPWIEGNWPAPHSSIQMRDCGTLLAKFHQSGSTIRMPKVNRQSMIGSWPSMFLEDQKMLENMIHKANQNGYHTPLDNMLQAHGNEILQMAYSSMHALRNSDILQLRQSNKAIVCHGDVGPTNIICTNKGMYLIDFETLGFDLRAYDLYRFIYNSCHTHNWSFAIARSILDGYQTVSKLDSSDYKLLKILLRFPRGICRLIDHYDERDPHIKRQIEREFPIILAHERQRKSFLKKLDLYAESGNQK